tara:strand:- start:354 stop:593 length:240 start_codon:yes stop_codon:yes gene_type:complete
MHRVDSQKLQKRLNEIFTKDLVFKQTLLINEKKRTIYISLDRQTKEYSFFCNEIGTGGIKSVFAYYSFEEVLNDAIKAK